MRHLKTGGDNRFEEIKKSNLRFFVAWMAQGLWVVITAAPLLVVLTKVAQRGMIGGIEASGLAVWLLGLTIETVADYQKSAFRANE